jgi:hypothetical protein
MSDIAERLDLCLRQLPQQRAASLERIIVSLLDMVESEVPRKKVSGTDADKRAEALAALNRIASRGGLAG